jgi:predicted TIM-barrel fold metal-dependent hydrolase
MQLVDAQVHLFAPGTEDLAKRLQQTLMTPEEVLEEMDAANVVRAYVVPLNSGANTACVEASRKYPDRFRVMGILGLDKPETKTLVADWPSSGLHGARLVFPPYRKVSWLKDGTADWFWPEAERLKMPIMIWAPEQADEIGKLAKSYRGIRFIVDHLNLFVDDRGETVARAVDALMPLAVHPNIAVKVTALPAHSSEPYPFRDMIPYVERAVATFGAERCLWGTDITRKACTYEQAIRMFTEHMPFLNAAQREQIMGNAATRWLGW